MKNLRPTILHPDYSAKRIERRKKHIETLSLPSMNGFRIVPARSPTTDLLRPDIASKQEAQCRLVTIFEGFLDNGFFLIHAVAKCDLGFCAECLAGYRLIDSFESNLVRFLSD
ncbi:MAG: hypothetical protein JWM11_4056 [Planctomycetaceae bacterium]|nr:hypothetical protein [Planctomycetaceae bacterium]